MSIEERIAQFLEDNDITVDEPKLTGFTRQEMDKPIYPSTSNNKFEVWIHYGKKKRLFAVFTGQGWRKITKEHAVRDILSHIREIGGSPNFQYWFKQCSGNDMYNTMLHEDGDTPEKRRELMGFVQRYFTHCKNIENKMIELLGDELVEQFYNLDRGEA